jgi:hypothetical protein
MYLKLTLNTLADCKLFIASTITENPGDGFTALTGTLGI